MKPQTEFRERVYTLKIANISGYKIHFVFSSDIHQSWRKRFLTTPERNKFIEQGSALHTATEAGHSWLFFKEDVGVSVFIHECWHAVYALLKWAEIPIDNNELIAYTLGYIVSRGREFHTLNDYRLGKLRPKTK